MCVLPLLRTHRLSASVAHNLSGFIMLAFWRHDEGRSKPGEVQTTKFECRWPESKLQCNLLFLLTTNVGHVVFSNIFSNIVLGLYS